MTIVSNRYNEQHPLVLGDVNEDDAPALMVATASDWGLRAGDEAWVIGDGIEAAVADGFLRFATDPDEVADLLDIDPQVIADADGLLATSDAGETAAPAETHVTITSDPAGLLTGTGDFTVTTTTSADDPALSVTDDTPAVDETPADAPQGDADPTPATTEPAEPQERPERPEGAVDWPSLEDLRKRKVGEVAMWIGDDPDRARYCAEDTRPMVQKHITSVLGEQG